MATAETGAVETDGSTEEMMENYKDRVEESIDGLPVHAEVRDGKLYVRDETRTDNNVMGLTDTRREVIRYIHDEVDDVTDFTQLDVADEVGCTSTTVSRTFRNFRPLLDNEDLYRSFVLEEDVPFGSDDWKIIGPNGEEYTDARGALDLIVKDWSESAIRGVEAVNDYHDDVVDYFERVDEGEISPEGEPEVVTERIEEDPYNSEEWLTILNSITHSDTDVPKYIIRDIANRI